MLLGLLCVVLLIGGITAAIYLSSDTPPIKLETVKIDRISNAGESLLYRIPASADTYPEACGVYIIKEQRIAGNIASKAEWDAQYGWVFYADLGASGLDTDTRLLPYALIDNTLLLGSAEQVPQSDAADQTQSASQSITIQQTLNSDGSLTLSMEYELSGMNPSNMYICGFMVGTDEDSLSPIGDLQWLLGSSEYLIQANGSIENPVYGSEYTCLIYYYPLSGANITYEGKTLFTPSAPSAAATAVPSKAADYSLTPSTAVTPAPTPVPTVSQTILQTVTPSVTPVPSLSTVSIPATPTPEPGPTPQSFVFQRFDTQTRFYFNQLTPAQKELFCTLYDGIMAFQALVDFGDNYILADVNQVFFVLQYDCPELFQWDGNYSTMYYEDGGTQAYISASFAYRLSKADYQSNLGGMFDAIEDLQTLDDFGTTDYDHQLAIYRHIKTICTYDDSKDFADSAFAPYLLGYAKCDGYANALMAALRYYGIASAAVCGDTYDDNGIKSPVGHCWNYVCIDGQWYHCDVTWDDEDNQSELPDQDEYLPFFNLNDLQMLRTRTIHEMFSAWQLPSCNSSAANYYVRSGIRIPSGSDLTQTIQEYMTNAYYSQNDTVILAFETAEDFNRALLKINTILSGWTYKGIRLRQFYTYYAMQGMVLYLYNIDYQ